MFIGVEQSPMPKGRSRPQESCLRPKNELEERRSEVRRDMKNLFKTRLA